MKRTAQVQIYLTTKLIDNERETNGVCDEVVIQLFNSDTEDEEFDGFPAQEEDKNSELESDPVPLTAKLMDFFISFLGFMC